MAQKLAETMTSMEERQKVMNDRMAEFVDQIRSLVREEQSETSRKMQSTLVEIGEAVRLQIAAINEAGDQAAHSHSEREGRMAAQADETVAKLASLTEGIMTEIRALTGEIRQTTDAMRTTTSEAVSRMSNGAATLSRAAEDFRKAGESVAGVLQQTVGVSGHLNQAAGSLSSSSAVLKGVIDDHALAREALAAMVADLRDTIENAKREASLTSDILARIESSAQKLGDAQNDAEHYLDGVTKVLTEAHGEFSEGLKTVLGEGYIEFYSQLSRATALLRTAIEELATTVEIIPPTRTKPATERVL
jgi:ABC-type transporter Mla subunit MlaD